MTDIIMDAGHLAPVEGTEKCSQPGCIRPAPHEGMRHRYAPTKDLQPEPEPEPVTAPVPDERPFSGPAESKPRAHALTLIDEKKGLSVAWDMCAGSGGCGKHISRCVCSTGPKMPDYVQRWRDEQFPIGEPEPAYKVPVNEAVDESHARIATHVCDACGEPLYLLDTPSGKSALTVSGDSNYCTVNDDAIHIVRDISDDDRKHNPQWFGGEDDEDEEFEQLRRTDSNDITGPDVDDEAPVARATDDPDYDEAEQQEVEASAPVDQTSVETEDTSGNIDPEVGF